jgi:hypothetical protein
MTMVVCGLLEGYLYHPFSSRLNAVLPATLSLTLLGQYVLADVEIGWLDCPGIDIL